MFTATILGLPGNFETALTTIAAAEDLPLHLAHLQFYGYGKEGPQGFSSAAPQLAEAVNAAKNVTHRRRAGDVRTDGDDLVRRAAAILRPGSGAAEEIRDHRRGLERRRNRALRISRRQLPQRGAIRRRLGAVPADRRPVARVLHHRSPEWRAVHDLPRDLRAVDGQGCAGRVGLPPASRGAGGDDAAVADARIYA